MSLAHAIALLCILQFSAPWLVAEATLEQADKACESQSLNQVDIADADEVSVDELGLQLLQMKAGEQNIQNQSPVPIDLGAAPKLDLGTPPQGVVVGMAPPPPTQPPIKRLDEIVEASTTPEPPTAAPTAPGVTLPPATMPPTMPPTATLPTPEPVTEAPTTTEEAIPDTPPPGATPTKKPDTTMTLSVEDMMKGAAAVNCTAHGGPIQIMRYHGGFMARKLDVESGKYSLLFDIPFELVQGFYKEINACGISPKDNKIYCAMYASLRSYIVRLSPGIVEFVVKLKNLVNYNSGAFDPQGKFFLSTNDAQITVLDNLHLIRGVMSKADETIVDMASAPSFKPRGWFSVSDLVTFKKDMGNGKREQFLASLAGPRLQLAKWAGAGFSHSWVIPTDRGYWTDVWGAAWNFNGRIFFAANRGFGVYEVPFEEIDFNKITTLSLKRVGASAKSRVNDGLNCMNMPDPWVTKVFPFDCHLHGGPLQTVQSAGGISVKKLNMGTSFLEDIYDIPWTRTSPPFKFLNGIGVNPLDHIPYGCLMETRKPGAVAYIVRFDQSKIEYVAKITASLNPIAGTFDSSGNYFFLSHPDEGNGTMYKVSGLEKMFGYASSSNGSIPELANSISGLLLDQMYQMADLVALSYDMNSDGNFTDYILGINRDQQVIVVKWDDDMAKTQVWRFKTNNVLGAYGAKLNFGAAWNFQGRIMFASNDGIGVFEATDYNVTSGSVTMVEVGKSSSVQITDGFNCPSASPWFGNATDVISPNLNFW